MKLEKRSGGGSTLLNNGFTLIELLVVIVILAIIALIATPIVLNVVEGSKESSVLRSGELYLKGVEQKILEKNIKDEFNPSTCIIQSDGNLICDGVELEIKASGEKPKKGTLTLQDGKVTNVENMLLNNYLLEMDAKRKLIIKGDKSSDTTPPEIKINVNTVTTNSIKVTVEATDDESEITGYYYSLNSEDSYNQGQNVQEFSDLKAGTSYTIYVKVVNEEKLEATDNVTETTLTIDMPKVEIDEDDWAYSKEVTITYPEVEGQSLIYSYLKEGEGWTTTQEVVTKVTFDSAGTIVAKVTDGTEQNTLTTMSYTVDKIDRVAPTITGVTGNSDDWTTSKTLVVNATDEGSGEIEYSFDNGDSWQSSNSKEVTENKTYNIKVRDKVKNENGTTVTVTKVDPEDPIVAATTGLVNLDQKGREIKVTASDVTTGINGYCITTTNDSSTCSWNSSEAGSYTYYKGKGTYYVFAKDKVGRISKGQEVVVTIKYAPSGLYVYYDNKDRGTTSGKWKDLSGNGNDGTINGATWTTNGLSFDGTNDWVAIGYKALADITLESVFIADTVPTGEHMIVTNAESGGHIIRINEGKITAVSYIGSGYSSRPFVSALTAKTLYHVTYTYDGNIQRLYLNGKLVDSYSIKGTVTQPSKNTIWALGVNPTGTGAGSNGYFDGTISLVRIYDRALTEEEVKENYLSAQ